MLTPEILLPAPDIAPGRDGTANAASANSPQTAEPFGDVMERALNKTTPQSEESNSQTKPEGAPANDITANPGVSNELKSVAEAEQSPPSATAENSYEAALVQQAIRGSTDSKEDKSGAANTRNTKKQTRPNAAQNGIPTSVAADSLSFATPQLAIPSPVIPTGSKAAASRSSGASVMPVGSTPGNGRAASAGSSTVDGRNERTAQSGTGTAAQTNNSKPEEARSVSSNHEAKPLTNDPATRNAAQPAQPRPEKASSPDAASHSTPDSKNTDGSSAKISLEKVTPIPAGADGTSAAKQDMTMKNQEKTSKVAGQPEQDLPGKANPLGEEFSATAKPSTTPALPTGAKVEATAAPANVPSAAQVSAASPTSTATTSTGSLNGAATQVRVLERTHDIVALHAMRLRDSNSDSLHVVVKPGAGIQLSLELRQSEGSIQVRAALNKGDFEHLSQHWPQLQQRLEARGVRVGALTCAENFSAGSQQSFQQSKEQSSGQDSLSAGAFAEFALAGSMAESAGKRAARASAYRGWETWA